MSVLSGFAQSGVTYTEAEVNALLAAKAASSHVHAAADTTSGVFAPARVGVWTHDILKASDQDVTNNATVQNDNTLSFAVVSGEVWCVRLMLLYAGNNATGDYKLDWGLPTATGWWRYLGDSTTADAINVSTGIRLAAATALAAQVSLGTDASLTPRVFCGELFFRAGGSATLQFKFANASAGTGRISRTCAGSRLQALKLA